MRKLLAAWRHWREVREWDRAYKRGTPVEIITPPGGIRVYGPESFRREVAQAHKGEPVAGVGPVLTDNRPRTWVAGGSTSTYTWRQA